MALLKIDTVPGTYLEPVIRSACTIALGPPPCINTEKWEILLYFYVACVSEDVEFKELLWDETQPLEELVVEFDFNETTVQVAHDSNPELILRDCRRRMKGYTTGTVGPYPSPVLTAEEQASDARVEAENERRAAAREAQRLAAHLSRLVYRELPRRPKPFKYYAWVMLKDEHGNPIKVLDLITPKLFDYLPKGTELVSISGDRRRKGIDYIDGDTRYGFLAYGFLRELTPGTWHNEGIYKSRHRHKSAFGLS